MDYEAGDDHQLTPMPEPLFDTRNGDIQGRWAEHMRGGGVNMSLETSCESRRLMANQESSIGFVGAVVSQWRSENKEWSAAQKTAAPQNQCQANASAEPPARPLAPPPRRGLLVGHNVGSGKTATMLGMAIEARRRWPECTVIIAADKGVASGLARGLPSEYGLFQTARRSLPVIATDGKSGASTVHRSAEVAAKALRVDIDTVDRALRSGEVVAGSKLRLETQRLDNGPMPMVVGPVRTTVTGFGFPHAVPEFAPLGNGAASVVVLPVETTLKNCLVASADSGEQSMYEVDEYGVYVLDENYERIPLAPGGRRPRPHWSKAPCVDGAPRGFLRMPDGPVVLLVDEAQNLAAVDGRSSVMAENYDVIATYLGDHRQSSNVFRVLLTATPGSSPREVTQLCALVASPAPAVQAIVHSAGGSNPSGIAIAQFTSAMRGCVDMWQMLGARQLYPTLRFQQDLAPFSGAQDASRHIQATCTGATSSQYNTADSIAALRDDAAVKEYRHAARLPDDAPLGAVLAQAIQDGRDHRRESQALRTAANAAVVSARILAQYTRKMIRGGKTTRYARIKEDLRRAIVESATAMRVAAADGVADTPPPCPLWDMAPRLAMLAYRIMRAIGSPSDAERRVSATRPLRDGWGMPPCKQLVVIPLSREQKSGYPQYQHESYGGKGAVQLVLKELCGLTPYKLSDEKRRRETGKMHYIDTSVENVEELFRQCYNCRTMAEIADADASGKPICSRFNYPDNDLGQQIPLVLIHDAARTTMYNMECIQRIHFTDWCDPTVAAQAMGRAQRLTAALRLPVDRRHTDVFTYSVCGTGAPGGATASAWQGATRGLEAGDRVKVADGLAVARSELASRSDAEFRRYGALSQVADLADAALGSEVLDQSHYLLAVGMATLLGSEELPEEIRAVQRVLPTTATPLFAGVTTYEGAASLWPRMVPLVQGHPSAPRATVQACADHLRRLATVASDRGHVLGGAVSALMVVAQWATAEAPTTGPRGDQSIDEMLARGYGAMYAPVLELYAALMRASVSCSLYAPLHRTSGQLPGLPLPCGIPQRTACLSSDAQKATCAAAEAVAAPPPDVGTGVERLLAAAASLGRADEPEAVGAAAEQVAATLADLLDDTERLVCRGRGCASLGTLATQLRRVAQ